MPTPDVTSYAQRFGLTVTPANVLGLRAVILDEAHRLRKVLKDKQRNVWLPELGGDPVSRDMSREFNAITRGLLDRAYRYVDTLFALCDELAATARSYGHTESQIEAKFARTDVAGLSPLLKRAGGLKTASERPAAQSWQGLVTGGRT